MGIYKYSLKKIIWIRKIYHKLEKNLLFSFNFLVNVGNSPYPTNFSLPHFIIPQERIKLPQLTWATWQDSYVTDIFFVTQISPIKNEDMELKFWEITSQTLKKVCIPLNFWKYKKCVFINKYFCDFKMLGVYKPSLVLLK